MLYLYVFAAVAGCLLVLVSLFGGGSQEHHGDGHGDGQGDAHGDAHGDAQGIGHADGSAAGHDGGHGDGHAMGHASDHGQASAGGDAHHHASDGAASGVPTALLWLLSIQLWTYLLAFGGLTGLLLRTVAHVGEPGAGLSALSVGLFTAMSARAVMRRMSVTTLPGTMVEEQMVGSTATVLIPAPAGGMGKVRLEFRGQTIDLVAKPSDGGALAEGASVTILDIRDGEAEVSVIRASDASEKQSNRGAVQKAQSTPERG